ncbi:STAS domain-containing protein [Pseudonocardia kujensis]|uniref:STAS domain-containing protein n=1 Tax=Pseudonocardia kujensis TaxID=1128675 RepID=UPI001E5A8E3B|nr:STAS domain-containing protein [Pseudonocardia kujensis]MCE0766896.1 STAS domain-containing protein [Pseudonocardia kujensis]
MTAGERLTCTWAVVGRRTGRLTIVGDLDHDQADEINRVLAEGLAAHHGLRAVHLDCAEVAFCDSYGLAALLMAHRHIRAVGARLHLDNLQPGLSRLLELTHTLEFLTAEAAPSRAEKFDT